MTLDISQLRKISNSAITKINETSADNARPNYQDDRFWKLDIDQKTQTGKALIRFLPSLKEGELPWVETWQYMIHGPKGWYIEKSLRTIKQKDPMAEYIAERWREATTDEAKQALRTANLNKPRHQYIANILVIQDPAHPENNGKVFLYRFGQMIYEQIMEKAKAPAFPGDEGNINVTDWDAGCNYKMNVYVYASNGSSFPRYDRCQFASQSAIGTDEQIVKIADQMYDLGEFVDPKGFKSYEALKERRDLVFGLKTTQEGAFEQEDEFESAPRNVFANAKPVAAPTPSAPVQPAPVAQPVQPTATPQTAGNTQEKDPWDDDFDFDKLMSDS